jgi:hypothetical protein
MLLAALTALSLNATAQITITNAVFPTVGDKLYFAVDADPAPGINPATPPGGNQTWNFTGLVTDQTSVTSYVSPVGTSYGGSFNGADLCVISGNGGETFFNKTNSKFEAMGYAGNNPSGFSGIVIARFNPAVIEKRAPYNFFDNHQQISNLAIPFSAAQIPDSLLGGFSIDSVRVRIKTDRLELVDAWGSCAIPGGTYPVLRVKRNEITSTALDIKLPFIGWVDLTTLLPGGGGFGNFLGNDTTLTYRFLSGTEKEEIAVATMRNNLTGVASFRFKNNFVSAVEDTDPPFVASVQAFPNPAIEWVRFDCKNLPNDNYTLRIYNILGKAVYREDFPAAGNRSVRVELEPFKKGTYLYSLADSRGKVIGTKRLVVVKP